ncbi:BrnA antitoxin family protein [uncultured Thiodictyon sp.]|jgi:uncharacterized protein (DUF4415 family)|uniref:BrnA antitoxin family protein n=1 Tax=uncultured Thiodictyon sp. TaxID=1846217 RepID=UPI0025E6871B|nr:BrnA antitoxin family protein [uncultured Thiodictyon sp.]
MKSKTSSPTSEPRLRVGLKDVSREEFATAVGERLGTEQVSIRLDSSVVAFFKAKAGKQGYETLINQALHRAMEGEHIEDRLRRVVREELASHRDERRSDPNGVEHTSPGQRPGYEA